MTEAKTPRPRRARTVSEMLLSIVLLLDAVLVFFVALTMYGLHVLEPGWVFGGAAAFVLLILVTVFGLRYQFGSWLGWMVQLTLILSGILLPAMYFVGAAFAGLWIYCFVRGRQIDARNAAASADLPANSADSPARPQEKEEP